MSSETAQTAQKELVPEPQFAQDMETEEITLKSGEKVVIGRPKGSASVREKIEAVKSEHGDGGLDSHGPAFNLDVRLESGQSFKTDPSFASRTGITRWGVTPGGVFKKHRIWFDTDQTYDYYFWDEEPDSYRCNVWSTGVHWVDYNSERPTIVKVSGS